ncbi:TPA: hypothetical protein EYP27_06860 [Candidatus Bathyarchaeota archaeon]|nr:hypothetical protein [Candidatus Bathyarchaeota archaeon]
MGEKLSVAFLELRILSHATEDAEKVYKAFKNVVTSEVLVEAEPSRQKLEGHYGNPITLLTLKTYSKPLIKKTLTNIFGRLSRSDKLRLLAELEDRIDGEGNFYLRLDKQAAYLGQLKLEDSDPIRVRIKLSITARQKSRLLEACKGLIEELAES